MAYLFYIVETYEYHSHAQDVITQGQPIIRDLEYLDRGLRILSTVHKGAEMVLSQGLH